MARSPSRHLVHCRLWVPDQRAEPFSLVVRDAMLSHRKIWARLQADAYHLAMPTHAAIRSGHRRLSTPHPTARLVSPFTAASPRHPRSSAALLARALTMAVRVPSSAAARTRSPSPSSPG